MLELVTLALFALGFGPQIVLSLLPPFGSRFTFTLSTVEQCGPVTITYGARNVTDKSVPMKLTFLPFNSVPITIPIPNPSVDSTGIYVTFVPFPAGTNFLASLDAGTGSDSVSDIIRVLPSPTGNNSCLPSTPTVPPFQLANTVSQCEPFRVEYDVKDTTIRAPSVRAYFPSLFSIALNETAVNTSSTPTPGRATYTASLFRQLDVLLLFDDGQNHRATTGFFSVGGDSSSPDDCLPFKMANNSTSTYAAMPSINGKTTTGAIVGIVLGVTLTVGGIAVAMLYWIVRQRKKRRGISLGDGSQDKFENGPRFENFAGVSQWNEKVGQHRSVLGDTPKNPSFVSSSLDPSDPGYVRNPTYTHNSFDSYKSIASWLPPVIQPSSPGNTGTGPLYPSSSMLQTESPDARASRASSNFSVFRSIVQAHRDSDVLPVEPPAFQSPLTRMPSRGHLREPSDIPATLSVTLSQLFPTTPGSTHLPAQRSVDLAHSSMLPEEIRFSYQSSNRSSNGRYGLPAHPRPIVTKPSREHLISNEGLPSFAAERLSPRSHAAIPRDVSLSSPRPSWYGTS